MRKSQYYYRDQYAKRGSEQSKAMFGADWNTANDQQKALRRAFRYKGAGEYYGDGGYWGDTVKPWLQRNVPAGTFASLGETYAGPLGKWAGSKLANYAGFGDYTANQLIDNATPTQVSVNSSSKEQDLYVEHTEFIGNITGTSAFTTTTYILNASHSVTFPWLSQLAKLYELYEFQGLIFQFKPLATDYSTNAYLGKIIMATAYDPYWTGFSTSIQMENYAYANSGKITDGLLHGVETALSQKPVNLLYNRVNNLIEGTRPADLSDLGQFVVATEGMPSTGTVGELWVTYKVRLSRPVFIDKTIAKLGCIGAYQNTGSSNLPPSLDVNTGWQTYTSGHQFDIASTTKYMQLINNALAPNTTYYWMIPFTIIVGGTSSGPTVSAVNISMDPLVNGTVTSTAGTVQLTSDNVLGNANLSWPSSVVNMNVIAPGTPVLNNAAATEMGHSGTLICTITTNNIGNGARILFTYTSTNAAFSGVKWAMVFYPQLITQADYNTLYSSTFKFL